MSKTTELARHLERLHINNMYKSDFYWTWDKTDEELEAIFTVADALRDLRERNKSTRIFDSGLGISIFRDNSTRTRFSFASACNLLGLEVQDLDEKKSQIAHGTSPFSYCRIMILNSFPNSRYPARESVRPYFEL